MGVTEATGRASARKIRKAGSRLPGASRLVVAELLTVVGFAVAIAVNALVPTPAGANLQPYIVGPIAVNFEEGYRFLLAFAIVGFSAALLGAAAWRPDHGEYQISRAPFRCALGLALALWDLLGGKLEMLPQPFFPGPSRIVEAFLSDWATIARNTGYSIRLFSAGFIIGVSFGVLTGIVIGWYAKAFYWIYPVLKISGIIPAVAWMPFALTVFAKPFGAAVFLIVICEWFPVAFMTAQGIQDTPNRYFEAARTLGAGTSRLLWHVAVPYAMPNIFTGITTANAYAFATLVMSEMMGQPGGLGYYINASKVWSAYNKVFAAIVMMAIIFSTIVKLTELVQRHVLRWRKGLVR